MKCARSVSIVLLCAAAICGAQGAELANNNWSALASDRVARKVGDVLTVLVYQSSTAENAVESRSTRDTNIHGQIQAGTNFNKSASLDVGGGSDNSGSTSRSGQMVAEITVNIDEVLPNGDLRVSGAQVLNINGERTSIRVKGRVRPDDISASNTVLSSRLADASIDYDGQGFVSRSAAPGIITRIFNWLGLP